MSKFLLFPRGLGRWWRGKQSVANGVPSQSLSSSSSSSSTVEEQETSKFALGLSEWWDKSGPFEALHSMNAVRVPLIKSAILRARGGAEGDVRKPLAGYTVLDVGCGAGLLCEPLARLGADVTGIDPVETSIAIARQHSGADPSISVDYKCLTMDELLDSGGVEYDCVVSSEVIEHVTDKKLFLTQLAQLVKPSGVAALTTISRTTISYWTAIVAAENVLGLVPQGTHEWNKFITSSELSQLLSEVGLEPHPPQGIMYNPLTKTWSTTSNDSVNYFIQANKPQ